MRGVSLAVCLSGFGQHWANSGAGSMYQTSKTSYDLSYRIKTLDHFLSHDWKTSRWSKLLTLLIVFNLRAATTITLITSVFLGARQAMIYSGRHELGRNFFRSEINAFPYVVFITVLCFWQRIRCILRRRTVFLDKLCIAQHDPELKAAGIMGLAAFLDVSKELVVLWSPRYFTRWDMVKKLKTCAGTLGVARGLHRAVAYNKDQRRHMC